MYIFDIKLFEYLDFLFQIAECIPKRKTVFLVFLLLILDKMKKNRNFFTKVVFTNVTIKQISKN